MRLRQMSQYALAAKSGVPQPTIQRILSGETQNPKIDTLRALGAVLSASESLELTTGALRTEDDGTQVMAFGATLADAARPNQPAKGVIGDPIVEWEKPEDLPDDAYFLVPRYDVHASAGNGHVVYEELEHSLGQAFRMDWLRRKGLRGMALRCIYAKGDSMCPVICDGFSLVLDTDQTTVQDGKIYVIRYGDEIRVKYLHKRFDGGLIIRSENKLEFPDVEVKADDMRHIEVLGRVVHVAGDY